MTWGRLAALRPGHSRRIGRRLLTGLRRRAAILLYHRVADVDTDPWDLAVSPNRFRAHLEVLAGAATILTLPELVRCVSSRRLPRRAVVVTFDDGYADNLVGAKPLLASHGVPATIFVQSGTIGSGRPFWWDELAAVLLAEDALPDALELDLYGTRHTWHLNGDASGYSAEDRRRHRSWRAWEPPPTVRHAAFLDIWCRLQNMTDADRRSVLDSLATSVAPTALPSSARPLTRHEVRELAGDSLVTIGAHTITHPRLGMLPESEQRVELMSSRRQLEDIVGRPVTTMSYPFGRRSDYTSGTVALAREAGFSCACANVEGVVRAASDLYQLPRYAVPNLDAEAFERWLDRALEAA